MSAIGNRLPDVIYPGVQLNPKSNSLNLLRLVLASLVIVAHAYYIAGVGRGPEPGGLNLGGWAVAGFFIISGYLITGSRTSRKFGEYITHRIARIYPGFIANLFVIILIFAPFSYYVAHRTIGGYLRTPSEPFAFLVGNLGLRITGYGVAGTPANVPFPDSWNGSLWTLYYEFLCYLIIGVILCFAVVRRFQTAAIAVVFSLSVIAHINSERLVALAGGNADLRFLAQLLPYFMGGALIYQLRKRIKYNLPGFILAAAGSIGLIIWLPGWGGQLASPLIGYAIMWVAMTLPSPEFIKVHDISYGVYIYGWPIEQLLAILKVHELGLGIYTVLALVCTIPFAAASWLLVERPAMRRARGEIAYPWVHSASRRRKGNVGTELSRGTDS